MLWEVAEKVPADTLIIVNPAAAGGGTGRRWPELENRLRATGLVFEAMLTSRQGDAIQLSRAAVRAGRPLVVACGGDGTINEVANGFFDGTGPVAADSRLGVLPVGTGGDLIKTFGIPAGLEAAVRVLQEGRARRIDAGRVAYRTVGGGEGRRYFLNIADAGIGGDVANRVNHGFRFMGGSATFMLASMLTLLRWRNKSMTVTIDGERLEMIGQQVVVANCQYFGGGMRMAPQAIPDDGLFDVITIGDVNLIENLRGLSRIRAGTHIGADPKLVHRLGRRVEVESPELIRIDVDGEQPGMVPAVFEMLPAALELMVPRAAV
jgi:YegS/Rv2252/BmrU family lipid kinase